MKKELFPAAAAVFCLLTACGSGTAEEKSIAKSAAETTTVTTASTESSVQIGTTKKGAGNAGTAKTAVAVQTTTTAATTTATTAAETQTERTVYWTPIGKYWHYSKDCAKKELPDVTYNYKNEPQTLDDAAKESMIHETPESFGMKDRWEPCPDCVAEESSQQDGE